MGYTFTCDHCGGDKDSAPPFMGELSERFLKTSPSVLTEYFEPGQTITICEGCSEEILL